MMAVRCAPRSCPVTPASTRFPVPFRRRPRFLNSTVRLGRVVGWPPCTLLKGELNSLHVWHGKVQSPRSTACRVKCCAHTCTAWLSQAGLAQRLLQAMPAVADLVWATPLPAFGNVVGTHYITHAGTYSLLKSLQAHVLLDPKPGRSLVDLMAAGEAGGPPKLAQTGIWPGFSFLLRSLLGLRLQASQFFMGIAACKCSTSFCSQQHRHTRSQAVQLLAPRQG